MNRRERKLQKRLLLIMKQMQEAESVTEELKMGNYREWIRKMNSISNRAEGIVLHEIIYTY